MANSSTSLKAYDSPQEQAFIKRRLEAALRLEPERRVSFLLRAANEFAAKALIRERQLNRICKVCGAARSPQGGPK